MAGHARFANTPRKRANGYVPDEAKTSISVAAYLQAAATAHQAGRLDEAKEAYETVLRQNRTNADALQLLGVLLHQQGDSRKGLDYLKRAVALQPDNAPARNNLAGVLRSLNDLGAAESQFAAGVRLTPEDIPVRLNHGIVLYELGRFDEARSEFEQVLKRDPGCMEAHRKLAHIDLKQGKDRDAEERLRTLLEKNPDHAEDMTNLGMAIRNQGRVDEAQPLFQAALGFADPDSELGYNLRTFLNTHEKTEEERERFREALRKNPKLWRSEIAIASSLIDRGLIEAAQEIIDDILAVHADDATIFNDAGAVLLHAGKYEEAKSLLQKAIRIDPSCSEAYGNLGGAFLQLGYCELAIQLFRSALKADPSNVTAQVNMVRALRQVREFDQAHLFGRGVLEMPGYCPASHFSGLMQLFKSVADFDALERLGDVWANCEKLRIEHLTAVFLDLLVFTRSRDDIEKLVALVRKWAESVEGVAAQAPLTEARPGPTDHRIRVGVLSSDLRSHSVMRFLQPLLEGHDRSKIAFHCYSPFRNPKDALQSRIPEMVDVFRFVDNMTNREIAQTIRRDGVDILLDLNGFTQGTRIGALAYRPAPVQMSWLGYPFTCGLKAIDYVLMDRFIVPTDEGTLVEEPLIMPDAWICFGKFSETEINPVLPMERNGVVTFGTLNNAYKFDRETIALWGRVMAQVPNSRFLMVRPEASSVMLCRNLVEEFAKQGIGADRLFLLDNWKEKRDHLSYYNEIDISLDTFPLTGGTTTCEALWMGVPVVSLVGEAYHQRISYAILQHCGLDELCVHSPDDFVARGVALANDRAKLSAWRTGLRDVMRSSPLCDEPRFLHQFQEMIEQVAKLHGLR